VLFPAAIYLVMDRQWSHVVWLVMLLVGLNWHQPNPMQFAPLPAALFAGIGSVAVMLLALAFRHRPRFPAALRAPRVLSRSPACADCDPGADRLTQHQSTLVPDSLITFSHFSVSERTNVPNSSGVATIGVERARAVAI